METVVVIERKTFEEIMVRFNRLASRVEEICHKSEAKHLGEWLDSAEVCRILQISPRTLQTMRSNGTLAYSQIVRKVYYRAECAAHYSFCRGTAQTSRIKRKRHLIYFICKTTKSIVE